MGTISKMKKKVLFLSPLPPPHYGSAMSSRMCLDILKKSGQFNVKNIKINFAKNMDNVGVISMDKILLVFDKIKKIKADIKKFDPDFIYFMPATSKVGLIRDFLFALAIKKLNKKIIYHVRTMINEADKNSLFKKIIYNKMFRGSKIIVLDKLLKDDVEKYFKPSEIFILPNAIKNSVSKTELNRIIAVRKDRKKFEILFLSNMYESKGWFLVLRACALLKKKSDDFICNFIGGWPSNKEKEKFFDFVKKNGLEKNVKYLGSISGGKRDAVYEKVDAFVFPTYYELEAHPRVIIEAMMYGLPIITNNHASLPTTIQDKKTGFLLKENSPNEIEKYLRLVEENKSLGIRVGFAGRKRFLENYEINKYEKSFIDIMKKV